MSFFKEELKNIKAFIFDVDGVLSHDVSPLDESGDPVRTANVKDGFAIRHAILSGFPVAVITGGFAERVRLRYEKIGVKYYYDKARDKAGCLNDFLEKTGIDARNVLYMGDDLVDYRVMLEVGVPTCPNDAVADIKAISKYVSGKKGGEGCVRDVIEQTLRAQGKWFTSDMLYQNAF
jgi:3-deoxy-D-manno-octulosonate 8-phosphate phosphatase (KDO 8-P phosphatase)